MRGRLRLELRTRDGDVVATRDVSNSVLRSGAELLAALFVGKGSAITHVALGNSDAPESDKYDTDKLSTQGDEPLQGETVVAVAPDAFSVEVTEESRLVHVRARTTLSESAAVGNLREAGLLARADGSADRLYNRVTFPTLSKGADHELTLFWEVSFPYGDLGGLY